MGLETATYISELVATNPVGGVDNYATADDHLRLVKGVLQSTFPNATGAVLPTPAEFNILDGALLSTAELNNLNGYTGNTADLNVLAGAALAGVTPAEVAYLDGVTSAIQTQLDNKAALAHGHAATDVISGTFVDARIAASNVTQHVAAIDHNATLNYVATQHRELNDTLTTATNLWSASKIVAELANYSGTAHTHPASAIVSGTFDNARIAAGNVTQHVAVIDHNSLLNYAVAEHRTINDAGTLVTDLWSANKITAELAGKAASSHTHAAADVNSGTFADARIAASNVTQHVAAINHDLLLGFVANEHLDWTADLGATNINVNNVPLFGTATSGTVGASGGGTTNYLRADGTWAAPPGGGGEINDLTAAVTWANIPDANVPVSAVTQHLASINHDGLLNFVADEHIAHSGVTLTAGNFLGGGGNIAANRTFNFSMAGEAFRIGPVVADDTFVIASAADTLTKGKWAELSAPSRASASTTDTCTINDGNATVRLTAGTAVAARIPANTTAAFPVNTHINFIQMGAGQVTISVLTDTLRAPNGTKIKKQYGVATAIKVDTTEWVLTGDLEV